MQRWKKHIKYVGWILFGIAFILPFGLLIWKSTGKSSGFIVANYQSYIDNVGTEDDPETSEDETIESVESYLKNKYGVSYDYFDTAENAKNLLIKNTGDLVNTTTYEIVNWVNDPRNLVHKLNWNKFGIKGITTPTEALTLFTSPVQDVLTAYDINHDGFFYNDPKNPKKDDDNLLSYGIPYFLQDYIFAYRGKEIKEFNNPNIMWKDFFDIMVNNQEVKERFKANGEKRSIFAVEDSRSFFTISNNIHVSQTNKNPTLDEKYSTYYLEERYRELANKFNNISNNLITFKSNANDVVNKLANWEIEGGFCYNGDALYAAIGGDDGTFIEPGSFHVVKPVDSIAALDMFVINNRLSGEKLDKAYKILGELSLGIYYDENNQLISPTSENYDVESSWTYRNFNYVNYTAPLMVTYDYINQNYFDKNSIEQKIFDVKVQGPKNFEEPISDLQKSNLQFKWLGFLASLK